VCDSVCVCVCVCLCVCVCVRGACPEQRRVFQLVISKAIPRKSVRRRNKII
jgi:hypothetical protein